jgi:hypothetical protein
MTRPTILLLVLVFNAAGGCLPSRYLAPKGGIRLTEPLPCNSRRDTHTDTQTDGRDLWSMPLELVQLSWLHTRFRHSKVNREGFTDTDSIEIAWDYFRKVGLKNSTGQRVSEPRSSNAKQDCYSLDCNIRQTWLSYEFYQDSSRPRPVNSHFITSILSLNIIGAEMLRLM